MYMPPFTANTCPVIYADSSDARNSTAPVAAATALAASVWAARYRFRPWTAGWSHFLSILRKGERGRSATTAYWPADTVAVLAGLGFDADENILLADTPPPRHLLFYQGVHPVEGPARLAHGLQHGLCGLDSSDQAGAVDSVERNSLVPEPLAQQPRLCDPLLR